MKLSIVIPAFNEEGAIGATIERTLAAGPVITEKSEATSVEIIVVSDGSTDRTAEIARRYDGVLVIEFDRNRGYGAAIKEGFAAAQGELVGFLDADGTCDPVFFAELCRSLHRENASVALGSRLGPDSDMPRVRRLGNRMYAFLLSMLSNRVVTDTASGMRVIRREVLAQLYPLPDGLHFTPAMSARVLADDHLSLVERPMPYRERIGESKLNVIQDGVRFLRTILEMTLMWRPTRLFLTSSMILLGITMLLVIHPIETHLRFGRLPADMMYRLFFCALLAMVGAILLSAGVLSDHLHRLFHGIASPVSFWGHVLDRLYTPAGLGVMTVPAVPVLLWLVGPGIWSRIADGVVTLHWSRVGLAGLILFAWSQAAVTILLLNLIRFHAERGKHASQRSPSQATHWRWRSSTEILSSGASRQRETVEPHVQQTGACQPRAVLQK